jgi:phosphonate transport system substrate-binding protein
MHAFRLLVWALLLPLLAGAAEPPVLRLAANPNLSAIDLLKNFGPFARELEKELGTKVSLVSGKDYDDTLRLLRSGQVDIAGSGAFGYISANEEFGAKLMVRYVEDNGDSYRALVIVRSDSGIQALKDLKGKRFAFTDPKSTSGYLMPLLALQQQGLDIKDFSKVEFVKKQPNSAIAVYTGQVDAGAIADNQLNEKYGVKLDELKVIWRSVPIPHGVWMARPTMADADVARVTAAILKISRSAEGKSALAAASVRGFAEARDSDFDGVRAAKRLLDKLEQRERP